MPDEWGRQMYFFWTGNFLAPNSILYHIVVESRSFDIVNVATDAAEVNVSFITLEFG
jgi:hypothetical protein